MNWVTLQLYLTLIFILMIISLHSVLLGKIILLSCTNPSRQVGWESFCIPANDIMQHNKNKLSHLVTELGQTIAENHFDFSRKGLS